jgi:protein phosphatase
MSKDSKAFTIDASALSDRGLNERRPLNEDSFLADVDRSIFAVADGVGGAEAGEVASQTAIEVLDEAFRHQVNGTDIEDLMELAIQRANASIHQMAQEHAKFSMMATTIVALHIDGNLATFGHVGDSRLYRLTPDGKLHRETEDHSVVEEEVRAGRMTAEQAANHPSKNVISRALGAEDSVEVDMKTIEVEEGTEFLLCTDGITRHISDNELRQLLIVNDDLESTCAELKRRCYERGAEDNLTVVIVRAGKRIVSEDRTEELEPTITPEHPTVEIPRDDVVPVAAESSFVPASRIAFPAQSTAATEMQTDRPVMIDSPPRKSSGAARFFGFLFVLLLIAGAFYAGARYRERIPFLAAMTNSQVPQPTPTPIPEDPILKFERSRRQVDRDPQGWITTEIPKEMLATGVASALDSPNPEFLYLYGRASLLTGNVEEAAKAFEGALAKSSANPSGFETTRKEAALGLAAASLKTQKDREKALQHYDENMKPPAATSSP